MPNLQDQILCLNTKPSEFHKGRMPDIKWTPYTSLEQNFLLVQDKSKFSQEKKVKWFDTLKFILKTVSYFITVTK